MPKAPYKELGISSKEYEEALLLERLFKLVKKNPCSTCLLKKPTHVDLDRFELLCTNCSKRCSSKIQIGKGLISMTDLERLEAIYDKSKKKTDYGSKYKKHTHKRSPSVSSMESYDKHRKDRYGTVDSDSSDHHRSRSKQRSKKKDTHRYQVPPHDYYYETYDKYPAYGTSPEPYSKMYTEDRYSTHHKVHKSKEHRSKERERSKDREHRTHRDRPRETERLRDSYLPRDYATTREQERTRDYPKMPGYPYYQPPHRYPEYEQMQPSYKYPNMNRHQTAYEYTSANKRDVPGMVGLLANRGRGQEVVLRNQWAPPALEDKGYERRKETKSQALALTNGYPGFRSIPPIQKEDRMSNNPFAKRTFEPPAQAYDFTNLREALNPPKTNSRYPEAYGAPRDFPSNKLGNPDFPDSSANYYNRY